MTTERGQWGGRREGAGRKSTWKSSACKAVKLPVALVDEVLHYAHQLDDGAQPVPAAGRDWDILARTIAGKAAIETRAQQLEQQLEKVVISQQHRTKDLETRSENWRVQNLEAQRTLSDALDEHRKTKRGIRVAAVEHALNALGGYQDFPNRKPPAASPFAAEERQRLAQLEAQNKELALHLDAVATEREQLMRELAAAREALSRVPAGPTPDAGEHDAVQKAVIALRVGLERKGGIRPDDARMAITALTGSPDGSPVVALPPAGQSQLLHMVDEKLAAERKARHLEGALAGERKQLRALGLVEQRLKARIADARSLLLFAYQEHKRGGRKGIKVTHVKSALLALGHDVDQEADGAT